MTDLSPAAQAVLDAYFTLADLLNREVSHEEMIAAALHTAADQVVPHEYLIGVDAAVEARQLTRLRLLAIATELEGQ
jgi:hypothetical protein